MRLILFHLLPFLCLGQYLSSEKKIEFNSYFDDGKEIIEKSWIEDGQSISLVEISSNEGTSIRQVILVNENDSTKGNVVICEFAQGLF